jgi:hypothetical protein
MRTSGPSLPAQSHGPPSLVVSAATHRRGQISSGARGQMEATTEKVMRCVRSEEGQRDPVRARGETAGETAHRGYRSDYDQEMLAESPRDGDSC